MKPFLKSLLSWLAYVVTVAILSEAAYLLLVYWTMGPMPAVQWGRMHRTFAIMSVVFGLVLGTSWWLSDRKRRSMNNARKADPLGEEDLAQAKMHLQELMLTDMICRWRNRREYGGEC